MGSRRKAQQYEQWPQLQRPMRSSDSPARTMIRGRSQTSRGSITLTSLKQFSLTSLASYLVGTKIHTHARYKDKTRVINKLWFLRVSGSAAKEFFTKSKLPILELSHIW